MTFRISMIVDCPKRTIVSHFAGCSDAEDAKAKAREVYTVIKFKSVEPAE